MLKKIFKKLFTADSVLCTAFVFVIMYFAASIAPKIEFLNPFDNALKDFEMLDLGFSSQIRDTSLIDTNFVLVNIGDRKRKDVAEMLNVIAAQKPLAVGIDAGFIADKDSYGDSLLEEAMSRTPNLVLYSMLHHTDSESEGGFDSVEFCNPRFARHGTPGFVNMVTPGFNEFITCRLFHPQDTIKGRRFLPLSLQVAWFADSNKVKKFLSRNNPTETINYRGNYHKFFYIDGAQLQSQESESGFLGVKELDVDPTLFRNRLVFLGYMGKDLSYFSQRNTVEDKFFTPLNENVAGKAYPDMFGVVVHANIASMVLSGEPIDVMSENGCILIALILCYLNVLGFFYIHRNHPTWYDLSVKIIQIFEVFLILGISIEIFADFNYKINLTIAAFAVGLAGDVLEVYVGLRDKILGLFQKYTSS